MSFLYLIELLNDPDEASSFPYFLEKLGFSTFIMIIYKDIFSNDEMASDTYKCKVLPIGSF